MVKKEIDWGSLGFSYTKTDSRFVSQWKDGVWDDGAMVEDANVTINESAGVLQYAQTCFEGLKAYTAEDGRVVTFRPDLNAKRMSDTAKRLLMPAFDEERFVEAVDMVVRANLAYVPPLWQRGNPVSASVPLWKWSGHRSSPIPRIYLQSILYPCRPVLQRWHQALEACGQRI